MPYKGYKEALEKSKVGIEVWKSLPGFEDTYEVSNLGRVRSLDRIVTYSNGHKHPHKGKVLVQSLHAFGYKLISICRNSQDSVAVHVLVLRTFYGNTTPDKPHCRHLDGVPDNNKLYNLTWGTVKENQFDRVSHGTNIALKGAKHNMAKLTDKKVIQIRELQAKGTRGKDLAIRFNVSATTISEIVNRKIWRHV